MLAFRKPFLTMPALRRHGCWLNEGGVTPSLPPPPPPMSLVFSPPRLFEKSCLAEFPDHLSSSAARAAASFTTHAGTRFPADGGRERKAGKQGQRGPRSVGKYYG
ncbi:hypothetical protein E2C01_094344 [Portunus trituberculatus]|uniref:Uncharacterized protein n=1 Tax=Portunus trituberculatus TaxID=210409 RepID=A0A5B7K2U8_PORTR|nr:hypothetical protein [Portunus trituberculatus]